MPIDSPPPLPETIERTHRWSSQLWDFICSMPLPTTSPWEHGRLTPPDGPDFETWPVYGYRTKHDTIPDRELSIVLGIPAHTEHCECIEPPGIRLSIAVMDRDTEESVPGTSELMIDGISTLNIVKPTIAAIAVQFHMFGTI